VTVKIITNYWTESELAREDKVQKPKWFKSNEEVVGGWIEKESYKGRNSGDTLYYEGNVIYSYGPHFPLAVKMWDDKNGLFYLVNGDRYSVTTSAHQSEVFFRIPTAKRVEIPFPTLMNMVRYEEGVVGRIQSYDWMIDKLYENLKIVHRSDESWIDTGGIDREGNPIRRHVLGSVVFRYGDSYYLSSIDDTGAGWVGLYFLSKLKQRVETVEQAYEALKPDEIKMVEKAGLLHERQGEWFFVRIKDVEKAIMPVPIPEKPHYKKSGFSELIERPYVLKSEDPEKPDRHYATQGFEFEGRQFVRGAVKHQFGEHSLTRLYDFQPDTRRKDLFWNREGDLETVYIGEPGYVTPESKREWYEAFENVQEVGWSTEGGAVD